MLFCSSGETAAARRFLPLVGYWGMHLSFSGAAFFLTLFLHIWALRWDLYGIWEEGSGRDLVTLYLTAYGIYEREVRR